jgi:hypothetical protein
MWIVDGYLDADDDPSFARHADACNLFGHSYKQWYPGLARHGVNPELTIWFPKLYSNEDWSNEISADGDTIYERRVLDNASFIHEYLNRPDIFKRLVFAAERKPNGSVAYHFKGLYEVDPKESLKTSTITYRRKEKRVNTYARMDT